MPSAKSPARRVSTYKIVQAILGILFAGYLLWRLYVVFIGKSCLRARHMGPFPYCRCCFGKRICLDCHWLYLGLRHFTHVLILPTVTS